MRVLPLTIAVMMAFGTSVNAQSVVKEISQVRNVNVIIGSSAESCNLTDSKAFESRLAEKLKGAGIGQSDKAELDANLTIDAIAFGAGSSCTYYIGLNFVGILFARNVVTDNPAVRATLDRLKYLPVTVYNAGRFGTVVLRQPSAGGKSTSAQEQVIKSIDEMVASVETIRTR